MKVLFVCPFVPWPLDSGGRIRTWHLVRTAAAHVELELWVVREPEAGAEALERLQDLGVRLRVFERGPCPPALRWTSPKIERWFWSPELRAELARLENAAPDLVHLDELLLARALPPARGIPIAQHHHKLDTVFQRRLARGLDLAARFDLWKLERLESDAAQRSLTHITCSEGDGELLRKRYPRLATWAVPSGFDPHLFRAGADSERELERLLFVGSMDYPPNVDGLRFFVRECWPALRAARPGLRLDVVGRQPTAEVRALAGEGVEVHGAVDEVVPWLRRANAMVVPLRIGGGTRLKIVEALSVGTPVVSTTVGAEGLGLRAGRELVLADTPAELRGALETLLDDPAGALAMGERGRAFVHEHYRWEALGERLAQVWREIAERGSPEPGR